MHESGSWQETKLSPDGLNEETLKKGLLAEEKAEFSKLTGTEEGAERHAETRVHRRP